MKEKLTVVKLGGNCMDDPAQLNAFLRSFAQVPGKKLLVHGGGKLATQLGHQLGIPAQMVNGRRVTCAETLRVVTMTYAGWINKNMVAQLQHMNVNAIGLSGADGNLVQSVKRPPTPLDYGFVGDPVMVNVDLLTLLISGGYTPVLCSITHGGNGQLLNTNADTMAAAIAGALADPYDVHLLFAFDKKGVLSNAGEENSVIRKLSRAHCDDLVADKIITAGMLPKITAGFAALEKNVSRVTLQHLSALEVDALSTQLEL